MGVDSSLRPVVGATMRLTVRTGRRHASRRDTQRHQVISIQTSNNTTDINNNSHCRTEGILATGISSTRDILLRIARVSI